jgi:hypothetical protein
VEDEYCESFGFFGFSEGVETAVSFDIYGGATVEDLVENFRRFLIARQYAPETVARVVLLNS